MRLCNSITAFLPIKSGIFGVHQVDIAIVSHRQILYLQPVAPEIEHRKIANSALRLASLTGQHDILRMFAFTNQMQTIALHHHAKRLASVLAYPNRSIVRVINPIDARIDIDGDAVAEVGSSILEGVVNKWSRNRCLHINHDMKRIKTLSQSQYGHESPQQKESTHSSVV